MVLLVVLTCFGGPECNITVWEFLCLYKSVKKIILMGQSCVSNSKIKTGSGEDMLMSVVSKRKQTPFKYTILMCI